MSDAVQIELIHELPAIIAALFAGFGLWYSRKGTMQNEAMKTQIETESSTIKTGVKEVHEAVNGNPGGLGEQGRNAAELAAKETKAQTTERSEAAEERREARDERAK